MKKALDKALQRAYIALNERRTVMKKMVNLRIPADTYAIIEAAAKANAISPYALMIKVLVAAASNYKPKGESK